MNRSRTRSLLTASLGLVALLAGCPGAKNADLELSAAEKAIADAAAGRAKACAGETLTAAEGLLREAKAAADKGDADVARQKAAEAEKLAVQAKTRSPEGCDKKDEPAPTPPPASSTNDVSAAAILAKLEQTIYFDYNDATIREDSKAVLTDIAKLLVADAGLSIEIEGHCDERGSTEYNLHLGERRAKSVEKYLMSLGVKGSQLSTISFGEERPIDFESNETAWAKNRRAEVHKR
jgi:peptidoglycan-associated lipoprotein